MKTIIQTPTNSLQQSLDFYLAANFKLMDKGENAVVSDGKAFIEINTDRFARAGLKMYQSDWSKTANTLRDYTKVLKISEGYLFSDASGMWIYLIEGQAPNFVPSASSTSVFGNFAGISLESIDMQKSSQIFETLGFTTSSGDMAQGWISLTNEEGFSISLMAPNSCPHLFFNPSLTYFNGENNLAIIEKVRELNFPIMEEITHFNDRGLVDNIIIRDPGGFGFFLFSD